MDIIAEYRRSKPTIVKYVEQNGIEDIGYYAAFGAVPLFAIWTYIAEDFPEFREEAEKNKQIIKEFYGYQD